MTNLTHRRLTELFQYNRETGAFTRLTSSGGKKAGSIAGTVAAKNGGIKYLQIQIEGELFLAHRLAFFFVKGRWPSSLIDHGDRDGLNNCWTNLREATYSQNQQNKKITVRNRSGFKGVSKKDRGWRARIYHNGKTIRLGIFPDPESAHAAYIAAANELFGSFMRAA